jgi:hypothetical protein
MPHPGWNERAVRRFLKKAERLLEHIMVMMHGAYSSRSFYVREESTLYITRHSKARKTTNQEFQVARYLPAKDSVALAM